MSTHFHPQCPLFVKRIETSIGELPDELDIHRSDNSGWITLSYRENTVARYLPAHNIAELHLHLAVDETGDAVNEPHEVTDALTDALSELNEREFEICHHYAQPFGDDQSRQTVVLRYGSIARDELVELISLVIEASRYAIDLLIDDGVAQNGSG